MPNYKSSKKRVLVSKAKTDVNKNRRTALKTILKKADAAVVSGNDASAAIRLAIKKVDQAAAKGLIHKNTAANKKSQLSLKLHSVQL